MNRHREVDYESLYHQMPIALHRDLIHQLGMVSPCTAVASEGEQRGNRGNDERKATTSS